MKYPCKYCGECPVWLAAYEEGTGLDTEEKIVQACRERECVIAGTNVAEDDEKWERLAKYYQKEKQK